MLRGKYLPLNVCYVRNVIVDEPERCPSREKRYA